VIVMTMWMVFGGALVVGFAFELGRIAAQELIRTVHETVNRAVARWRR
jgi:hypothetical protein